MTGIIPIRPQALSGKKFKGADFSKQDLHNQNLSHSEFINCNFDEADLSEANCEFSNFTGSTFRDTNMRRTNMRECCLQGIVFEPRDAYGITFTFACQTFKSVRIGQLWWFAWVFLATTMYPTEKPNDGQLLRDQLIAYIGAERYAKLTDLFRRRET